MLLLRLHKGTYGRKREKVVHACEVVRADTWRRPGVCRTLCGYYYRSRWAEKVEGLREAHVSVTCKRCSHSLELRLRRPVGEAV